MGQGIAQQRCHRPSKPVLVRLLCRDQNRALALTQTLALILALVLALALTLALALVLTLALTLALALALVWSPDEVEVDV